MFYVHHRETMEPICELETKSEVKRYLRSNGINPKVAILRTSPLEAVEEVKDEEFAEEFDSHPSEDPEEKKSKFKFFS